MLSLQAELENAGGVIVFNSTVTNGCLVSGRLALEVRSGDSPFRLTSNTVVNCAGLGGDRLAHAIEGINRETLPAYRYARGNYFTCPGRSPFNSLIYPLPNEYGLGVHVTLDMAGNLRFGPDVEWVDSINYEVDPSRGEAFYEAIRSYWPDIMGKPLLPAYSGIRPKINGRGMPAADFQIQGEKENGIPGLINLFGIESPGRTSSLAIADYVKDMAG
jgi:L-2-hydroxyglutarate oxidase LhgO